jgi:hypothetical protein
MVVFGEVNTRDQAPGAAHSIIIMVALSWPRGHGSPAFAQYPNRLLSSPKYLGPN